MSTVSILGLGIIGSRIAKHLVSQGVDVTVWNRTPKNDYPSVAATPADAAAASNIISLFLKDRNACLEVFEAMRPALTKEHIILNHSTIDRDCVLELAKKCQGIGCVYLDTPFTGSKLAAQDGNLVYYIAGDQNAIAKVLPLLEKSSKAISQMGELGNATVLKLVTNLINSIMVEGLSEGYAIARSYGIGVDKLLEAISSNVVSSPLAAFKLPYMAEGDYDTHFSLDNMRKDSEYAIKLAQEKGLDLPAISLVSALMSKLCQKGLADMDYSSLMKQFDS